MTCWRAVALLALSAPLSHRIDALRFESLPFVHISSPEHFACVNGSSLDIGVEIELYGEPASLEGSSLCFSVDSASPVRGNVRCIPFTGAMRAPRFDLSPGCHALMVTPHTRRRLLNSICLDFFTRPLARLLPRIFFLKRPGGSRRTARTAEACTRSSSRSAGPAVALGPAPAPTRPRPTA